MKLLVDAEGKKKNAAGVIKIIYSHSIDVSFDGDGNKQMRLVIKEYFDPETPSVAEPTPSSKPIDATVPVVHRVYPPPGVGRDLDEEPVAIVPVINSGTAEHKKRGPKPKQVHDAPIEKKKPGRPRLSDKEKAKRVAEKDAKKKRVRKNTIDEVVLDASPVSPIDETASIIHPIEVGSGVTQLIVEQPQTSPQDASTGEKGLAVVQQSKEERFPIRNLAAFVDRFPFTLHIDKQFLIYVVTSIGRRSDQWIEMRCKAFHPTYGLGAESGMRFELPKLFGSKLQFYYLTPNETVQFYSKFPFGYFGQTLEQVQAANTTYFNWLHATIKRFMRLHPQWVTSRDHLFLMAEIVKHHVTNQQIISLVLQGIVDDCMTDDDVEDVFLSFHTYLKDCEGYDLIEGLVDLTKTVAKRRVRVQTISQQAQQLPFQKLTPDQFNELEAILLKIESINKSNT